MTRFLDLFQNSKIMSKNKNKKKRRIKDVDWSADEHFDKGRSLIYIEHSVECPIFQVKADAFADFLQERFPERMFQLVRNNNGKLTPRDGAFEIQFSQNARTSKYNLWSGLDKGPPRRDKFPDFETLVPEVQRILKKFYPDVVTTIDDGDDDYD